MGLHADRQNCSAKFEAIWLTDIFGLEVFALIAHGSPLKS
jgi:hypothetical protein